jgi:hypothetical protein
MRRGWSKLHNGEIHNVTKCNYDNHIKENDRRHVERIGEMRKV